MGLNWSGSNGLKVVKKLHYFVLSRFLWIHLVNYVTMNHYHWKTEYPKNYSRRAEIHFSSKKSWKFSRTFLRYFLRFLDCVNCWRINNCAFVEIKMPRPPKTAKFIIPGLWVWSGIDFGPLGSHFFGFQIILYK